MVGRDSQFFVSDEEVELVNTAATAWELATEAYTRQHAKAGRQHRALRTMGTIALLALIAAAAPRQEKATPFHQRIGAIVEGISALAARGVVYIHAKQEGRPDGTLVGFANGYIDQTGKDGECIGLQVDIVSTASGSLDMTVAREDGSRVVFRQIDMEPGFESHRLQVCPRPGNPPLREQEVTMTLEASPLESTETQ